MQELQRFKEQTKKSIQRKGENYLLFSGLKYKGGCLHMLTTEDQITSSGQLKDLFVKEADSSVHLVTYENGFVTWESSNTLNGIPLRLLSQHQDSTFLEVWITCWGYSQPILSRVWHKKDITISYLWYDWNWQLIIAVDYFILLIVS